jgi:hypothetical protein
MGKEVIMTYKLRDKKKRNQELYNYYLAHEKEGYTYKEIGEFFHVSAARAFTIVKQQRTSGN